MSPSIFDAHVDTLLGLRSADDFLVGSATLQFDQPRGIAAGVTQSVTAICAEASSSPATEFHRGMKLYEEISPRSEIELLLMLEGCEPLVELEKRSSVLDVLSVASLTWNGDNSLAGGIGSKKGLSSLGRALTQELLDSGVKLDVSHLCDRSRKELLDSDVEVVATHCNCRELQDCPRNLPDDDILAIAESGGVIGITLVPDFLGENASLLTVVDHLEHLVSIAGIEHAGFGSDLDGTQNLPQGVDDCTFWNDLFMLLEDRGWNRKDIDAVAGDNWRRIMKKR